MGTSLATVFRGNCFYFFFFTEVLHTILTKWRRFQKHGVFAADYCQHITHRMTAEQKLLLNTCSASSQRTSTLNLAIIYSFSFWWNCLKQRCVCLEKKIESDLCLIFYEFCYLSYIVAWRVRSQGFNVLIKCVSIKERLKMQFYDNVIIYYPSFQISMNHFWLNFNQTFRKW